ncbi:heme anaerobic degradation radical SAM methyltransferase ChuW/HutW [Pararhodospirillum photometricum]|uniref:Oxygen-independent coproporphyrinogen-III oxidase, putative n=1 Tax=Pararhodospirillum photometricum DSM 122 TaxID=1150469 RepID=H6SMU8_PARPM|nr:heme anaerobic degradation radical SAM methyltransferase ChuW/HutW [Pararhodospirillum photometricum]CCG09233.1 Oxygen-independent coproporphyrinogen-III oxidase, putative [Pararhodospirillum photometricum DSM 122]
MVRPEPVLADSAGEIPPGARARLGVDPLTEAFAARRPTHWFAGPPQPVDPQATWSALVQHPRTTRAIAYVHVPFCVSHCLFCGFYRHSAPGGFSAPYTDAVIREIEGEAGRPAVAQGAIGAVYLGGGTPTALDADDLARLLKAVRACLPLAGDCEITVEARVHGFDPDKVDACLEAGANRFSVGVQTFDTAVRRRLGRRADRDTVIALLQSLQARDRAVVVCDLMYGLPGQTLDLWLQDVRTVLDLGLDGVDLYALSMFPNSGLARAVTGGHLPAPAPLGGQARLYAEGLALLDGAGWRHLTQAHWARTTRERNLYNQMSREQTPCLAFGAGAGGLLHGYRYTVEGDEATYRARVACGEKPLALVTPLPPDLPRRARLAASLESGRILPEVLEAVAGPGFVQRLAPVLEHWQAAGLITPDPGGPRLTPAGWFWQTNLIAALHDHLSAC